MKNLIDILERRDTRTYLEEPEPYLLILDQSFIDGNGAQPMYDFDNYTTGIEAFLENWGISFTEEWLKNYNNPENEFGLSREELEIWGDRFEKGGYDTEMRKFLKDIENLKPWDNAQFIIDFPKRSIVVATVIKIGPVGTAV